MVMIMKFQFQQMKSVLQKDFDDVCQYYPTNLDAFRAKIPHGGDALDRKLAIIETAAEECPVRLFGHYPFAFELDVGEPRHVCYIGVGNLCTAYSGVDRSPVNALREMIGARNLGSFGE